MSRRDFFQLFCMFYLRLINRKCAEEKKHPYLTLYQNWNRTPVYFELAVSASYVVFNVKKSMSYQNNIGALRDKIFLEHSTAILLSTADHILIGICKIWYSQDCWSYCKSMIYQKELQSFKSFQWTHHCRKAVLPALQLLHYLSFCNRKCST